MLWKIVAAFSTFAFLGTAFRPLKAFILGHLDALVDAACVLYLGYLILRPEKVKVEPLRNTEAAPVSLLRVDHLTVEPCSLTNVFELVTGNTHQVATVDLFNNPASMPTRSAGQVIAKLTYYDSTGHAYLTVDRGRWISGHTFPDIDVACSERLIIAASEKAGGAFAMVSRYHDSGDWWEHSKATLRNGRNEVSLRLSYLGQSPYRRETQEFKFSLSIGENMELIGTT